MKNILYLILISFLLSNCTINEEIQYDKDFNSNREIIFEIQGIGMGSYDSETIENKMMKLKSGKSKNTYHDKNIGIISWVMNNTSNGIEDVIIIDSLFNYSSSIENYELDTISQNYLSIKYFKEHDQNLIKNKDLYYDLLTRMDENYRWYFKYPTNTITRLNKKNIIWKVLDIDLFNIDFPTYEVITGEVSSGTLLVTKSFKKRIKYVSNSNVLISNDRYSLKCKIELSKILDFTFNNEIAIEFE